MSEFENLLPDSGPLVDPDKDALPPLTDEENQALEESLSDPVIEGAMAIADLPPGAKLELLRPNEVPVPGQHYIVWGQPAMPMPVLIGSYRVSEDEHVRTSAHVSGDPVRDARAEAYARWRFKGYLAGQVDGL